MIRNHLDLHHPLNLNSKLLDYATSPSLLYNSMMTNNRGSVNSVNFNRLFSTSNQSARVGHALSRLPFWRLNVVPPTKSHNPKHVKLPEGVDVLVGPSDSVINGRRKMQQSSFWNRNEIQNTLSDLGSRVLKVLGERSWPRWGKSISLVLKIKMQRVVKTVLSSVLKRS